MKSLILIVAMSVSLTLSSCSVSKLGTKQSRKELSANVDKDSQREAKRLRKAGWMVMPGNLPIDKQVYQSRLAAVERDEEGMNTEIIGVQKAFGGNYSAAKMIASTRAKVEIASKVAADVKSRTEDKLSQLNLGAGDLRVVDEVISASIINIDVTLVGLKTLMEVYRPMEDDRYEVMIVMSADYKESVDKVVNTANTMLQGRTDELSRRIKLE